MISENIKKIRQANQMNQTEFASVLGISRTSLSRYELGAHDVPYSVIDTIAQKFNLSYVEILGEDKMLSPIEDYNLTIEIEVVKELGASVLAEIYNYLLKHEIKLEDKHDPISKIALGLSKKINTEIYSMTTFEEVSGLKVYIHELSIAFSDVEAAA